MTKAQQEALKCLASGVEQIRAAQAKPLAARGLATIESGFMTPGGWVRATITDAGREAL